MLITDGKYDYNSDGNQFVATKNSTTTNDFKVATDKVYVSGGEFLYANAVWGDYITVQFTDKDNIMPSPYTGFVKTHISKRYLHPDETRSHLDVPYAGKVPKDCYIRLQVISTGVQTDLTCAVNYDMHEEE